MDRTIRTRQFLRSEPATLQSQAGVIEQLPAFRAQVRTMMAAAVNVNHRRHRFPFASQPRVSETRGGVFPSEQRKNREDGIHNRRLHAVIIVD
jgi:hypothetical protein